MRCALCSIVVCIVLVEWFSSRILSPFCCVLCLLLFKLCERLDAVSIVEWLSGFLLICLASLVVFSIAAFCC